MGLAGKLYRKIFGSLVTQSEKQYPADTATDSFLHIWEERARTAYDTYGLSVGWVNYAGLPMPKWHELPRRIRAAWCLSIQGVWDTYSTWEK